MTDKKALMQLVDEVLAPLGFTRKNNQWVFHGRELSKVLHLQRSSFSKSYYLNYGFILNGLTLTTTTHVQGRLGSTDPAEQQRITALLDLENDLPLAQRLAGLKPFLEALARKCQEVNTREDLVNELKRRPHLNDIPLVVKEYLQLP